MQNKFISRTNKVLPKPIECQKPKETASRSQLFISATIIVFAYLLAAHIDSINI